MLNVKAAADRAGISPALLYIWIEEGLLPHFRLGKPGTRGAIRIAEADLDAYLASLKRGEQPKESVPPAPKRKITLKHLRLK
jgi:predicted site-specific integrase-resolvase